MIVVKRETGNRYPALQAGEGSPSGQVNDVPRIETWLRAWGVSRDVSGIQPGAFLIIDPADTSGVLVLGPTAFAEDWEIPEPDDA
jgi:hypothetical protein